MLTFIAVLALCLIFPMLIPAAIGYSIGGAFLGFIGFIVGVIAAAALAD